MSFRSKNSLGDTGGICPAFKLYITQRRKAAKDIFFSQRGLDFLMLMFEGAEIKACRL